MSRATPNAEAGATGTARLVSVALLAGAVLVAIGAFATLHGAGTAVIAALLVLGAVALGLRGRMQASHLAVAVPALLLLVPARDRISPLGAAGTPAVLLGLLCLGIWLLGYLTGRPILARGGGIRWGLAGVLVTTMISYVAAGFRPHDQLEARAADRGLFTLAAALGLAILVAEVLPDRAALRRVVATIAAAGTVVAGLGIVQFLFGIDLTVRLRIPGFTFTPTVIDSSRAGFTRIVSTTSHPIELAVVLAMVLPLLLWLVFTSTGRPRLWWGAALAVVGISIPMTVSRTGVVGLVVALVFLAPTWTWRRRRQVAVAGVAGLLGVRVLVPGLMGTLASYLFDPGGDPSLVSRDVGRQRALAFLAERPWFGRGFGTFLPERYGYLDNQVLLGAVEVGVIGQLAYALLFVLVGAQALRVRRAASGPHRDHDRELAASLLASLAVSVSTWLTYDALGFPTSRSLTFVVVGLIAALYRIQRTAPGVAASGIPSAAPAGLALQSGAC